MGELFFRRPWLAALILLLPVLLPGLAHFLLPGDGRVPTGFLQYDQASYMAMAREHFDQGFSPTYGLPFSPDSQTPRVYLQPQSLVLGSLLALTGLEPGVLFYGCGLLAALVFFRIAIALWRERVQAEDGAAAVGATLLCWGGGLLALAGLAVSLTQGGLTPEGIFRFDPLDGYWFLNAGRNAWYTLEAYYHALAFGLLLALLRRRYALALLLLALLSWSHPFTGLQFLLIAGGWSGLERLLLRSSAAPPLWFPAGAAALLALHLGYHLWFLPTHSPEHASVMTQWMADTPLSLAGFLLAYALVLPPAVAAVARGLLRQPESRLFLLTALTTLALMTHDLVIEARQPLHFSRGYLWSGLLLLGAPPLHRWLGALLRPPRSRRRLAALAALLLLFVADNGAWFAWRAQEQLAGFTQFLLRPVQWAVLEELRRPDYAGHTLVSTDLEIGYLVTVYTPLRSWRSHGNTTPDVFRREAEIAAWMATGEEPPEWRQRPMVFVWRASESGGGPDALAAAGIAPLLLQPEPGPALLLARRGAGGAQ